MNVKKLVFWAIAVAVGFWAYTRYVETDRDFILRLFVSVGKATIPSSVDWWVNNMYNGPGQKDAKGKWTAASREAITRAAQNEAAQAKAKGLKFPYGSLQDKLPA